MGHHSLMPIVFRDKLTELSEYLDRCIPHQPTLTYLSEQKLTFPNPT